MNEVEVSIIQASWDTTKTTARDATHSAILATTDVATLVSIFDILDTIRTPSDIVILDAIDDAIQESITRGRIAAKAVGH